MVAERQAHVCICNFYDYQSNDEFSLLNSLIDVDVPYCESHCMVDMGMDYHGNETCCDAMTVAKWRWHKSGDWLYVCEHHDKRIREDEDY